jgi:hypothetical protein
MPRPELPPYGEPRNTPQALIDLYERMAAPLDADAIRTIVEPFTGSSFADIMIHALQEKLQSTRQEKPELKGSTLYLSLFHKADDHHAKDELQGYAKDVAELAIQSHLSHAVTIDLIFPDYRLAPGEMAFWQCRYDIVWNDEAHLREAFTHRFEEWRLYKDGSYLGDIPIQSLERAFPNSPT